MPPDEQAFRLRAERAIVVNFKCIPQISGELREWRDRLNAILAMDIRDLRATSFERTLVEMRTAYERRPPAHLAKVAQHYNARYLLLAHRLDHEWEPRRVAAMDDATHQYFLYDLQR